MAIVECAHSSLLFIDFQARLMPAIHDAETVVGNACRLAKAAVLLDVPTLFTEQNPRGLGATLDALAPPEAQRITKFTFDACRVPGFMERLKPGHALVVTGCEAHVCVLQTVLSLRTAGRRVVVVADALGARRPASHAAALTRMAAHGAEIVTTEMVLFEWLESAEHPHFREVLALIR